MPKKRDYTLRLSCLLLALLLITALSVPVSATEQLTALEMHDAFIQYMNDKAESLGMTGSHFNDSIGMNNTTTARDFLKLMVHAYSYDALKPVWEAEEYTVTLDGADPRTEVVRSTIRGNDFLDPYYTILACKDGELTHLDLRNLAVILKIPGSDKKLAVVALGAYGKNDEETGSRAAVRQIADAAVLLYSNPQADVSNIDIPCRCAIACLVPEERTDLNDLQILYEKNTDQKMQMASITKVMTAVCLLDIQKDLEKTFTYIYFDTVIGGYYANDFYPEDTISYQDALYALLLPSSNITARALAREGGKVILEENIPAPTTPTIPPEITEPETEPEILPTLPQREPPHLR